MADRRERLAELFREEAREMLGALSAGALRIERGEAEHDAIAALFRSAHTIKGGARMLGLDDVASVAERLEARLGAYRGEKVLAPPELGADILTLVDGLRAAIWPAGPGGESAGFAIGPAVVTRPTVRVQPERIDAVVGLVAEARRFAAPGPVRDLLTSAETAAIRLRLVSLGGSFDELRRAVRETATADGRQARLEATGGEVEADAAVVDAAIEIVLQIVRNAVAHGIERPVERLAAGKAAEGVVRLDVRAAGGWLELTVADDGRGLDEAALRDRARGLGLNATVAASELLFAPGLSTRLAADQLGGQGVGLDVARTRARAVGGDVVVTSAPGLGATFTTRLPVAALYERLITAEIGESLIGIPVDTVVGVGGADSATGISVSGRPEEVSVLTVPLGQLFAGSPLAKRAWISPDGRVGLVLERGALGD